MMPSEAKRVSAIQNARRGTEAVALRIAARPPWTCAECGKEAPATAHQLRQTYCSKECMARGYEKRMAGEANPNYRAAHVSVCKQCGGTYAKTSYCRKYCSKACARVASIDHPRQKPAHVRPRKAKPALMCAACGTAPVFSKWTKHCGDEACAKATRKVRSDKKAAPAEPANNHTCQFCKRPFHSYNKKRRYCSYPCHLASGGAFRAGLASREATMRYGPKKDANHNEIFEVLRKCCAVYDLSVMGCGVPDGLAWVGEQWRLFDVKNPKTGYGRRGLNKVQKKWLAQWQGGPVYLIHNIDEATRFSRGEFDGIKSMTPEAAKAELESA